MTDLKGNIRVVELLPLTVTDETIEGSGVDMYETANAHFETALILASVGAVGGDVTALTIKIEESDASDFGSGVTTAKGGDAQNVLAGDETFVFQITRTKRYIRAVVTETEDGEDANVEVAVVGLLTNWSTPMPLV
jgi:hypothetical protein